MKLDSWRDPYLKDAHFAGELVSSREPPKKPPVKRRLLKYGTGCENGGPDCFNCSLPTCTWHAVWGRDIEMRNVEVT